MLLADLKEGQKFLFPSKNIVNGKYEKVFSIIDTDEKGNQRILSTVYVQGYNCSVVHNGVYTKTGNPEKYVYFRYEISLASLEPHVIDIPNEHLMGEPVAVFRMTAEHNQKAIKLRAREFGGMDSDDDEYYSSKLAPIERQTSLPTGPLASTTTVTPAVVTPPAPKKKYLYLVQTDINPYLLN